MVGAHFHYTLYNYVKYLELVMFVMYLSKNEIGKVFLNY